MKRGVPLLLLFVLTAGAWADPPARRDRYGDLLPSGAVARLGTVRFRHGSAVHGLIFLPDGNTLLANYWMGHSILCWEASTGKRLRKTTTGLDTFGTFRCAFSSDGKYVAITGALLEEGSRRSKDVIRVLETASGRPVRTFSRTGRKTECYALVLTPDGKTVISLDRAGTLLIENVATGAEVVRRQFAKPEYQAALALSPDGSDLAVAVGEDHPKLYLWRWRASEEPREVPAPKSGVSDLAFSPDGKSLAACYHRNGAIHIWDASTGRLRRGLTARADTATYCALKFSPDGRVLAAAASGSCQQKDSSGVVHLWDPTSGKLLRELPTAGEAALSVAISPDSRRVAAGTGSRVHVWDLRTGQEMAASDDAHQDNVNQIAVSRDGLVATAGRDHTARLWDLQTGRQRHKLPHGAQVPAVAFSPDGTRLATASDDEKVHLWDVRTGRELFRWTGGGTHSSNRPLGFTLDGKRLCTWGSDTHLRAWDTATGKPLLDYALRPTDSEGMIRVSFFGQGMFAPDGETFLLACDTAVYVYEVRRGKKVRTIETKQRIAELAVSPDGKLLLIGGWGRDIETPLATGGVRVSTADEHPQSLWELITGQPIRQINLPGHVSGPLAFTADGTAYATMTYGAKGTIRIWGRASGEERPGISEFREGGWALAFSPDGRYMLSGLDDTTVLVWDLAGKR
jgi:WD40 repeat protein